MKLGRNSVSSSSLAAPMPVGNAAGGGKLGVANGSSARPGSRIEGGAAGLCSAEGLRTDGGGGRTLAGAAGGGAGVTGGGKLGVAAIARGGKVDAETPWGRGGKLLALSGGGAGEDGQTRAPLFGAVKA